MARYGGRVLGGSRSTDGVEDDLPLASNGRLCDASKARLVKTLTFIVGFLNGRYFMPVFYL